MSSQNFRGLAAIAAHVHFAWPYAYDEYALTRRHRLRLSEVTDHGAQSRTMEAELTHQTEQTQCLINDLPGTEAKMLRLCLFLQRKSPIGFGFDVLFDSVLTLVRS